MIPVAGLLFSGFLGCACMYQGLIGLKDELFDSFGDRNPLEILKYVVISVIGLAFLGFAIVVLVNWEELL